jgi:hypothetical protein
MRAALRMKRRLQTRAAIPYYMTCEPTLPVCQVVLSAESSPTGIELMAVLDIGADGTIAPENNLQEIGARRVFETGLRSQCGERRTVFYV